MIAHSSWQKRGHRSLNGIVSVTSLDTGRVLDDVIMSKNCLCTILIFYYSETVKVSSVWLKLNGKHIEMAKLECIGHVQTRMGFIQVKKIKNGYKRTY